MGNQIQVRISATGKHHMEGILSSEFVQTLDTFQLSVNKSKPYQLSLQVCLIRIIIV